MSLFKATKWQGVRKRTSIGNRGLRLRMNKSRKKSFKRYRGQGK